MCGIVGIVSNTSVSKEICAALKLLEYRGYDSAGIVTVDQDNFQVRKALGKLHNLEVMLENKKLPGNIGIGHTRWATHGAPKLENTHPIIAKDLAVVHNGIIENYHELKAELVELGYKFLSETDTEVIPHLIDFFQKNNSTLIESILLTTKKLKGSFALGVISQDNPDIIIAVKYGSPLLVALSNDKKSCYLASDAIAIAEFCREVTYLEDGQIAILERDRYNIMNFEGEAIEIKKEAIANNVISGLDGFANFMSKEIYEQPSIINRILEKNFDAAIFTNASQIVIVGCGTSLCAGLIAKEWVEANYGIRVNVEIASEFSNKKNIIVTNSDLFVFISQSGETADTLAALKRVSKMGGKTLGVVNTANSTIARLANSCILIDAGVEIAVAATKTFLAQLAVLGILAGLKKSHWQHIPNLISDSVKRDKEIFSIVQSSMLTAKKVLFIGRGLGYPLAIEGALKLKELSYIPSEGIAAGELKHGSIALIDDKTPIVVIAPEDHHFAKISANINEVKARGGIVILIANRHSIKELGKLCDYTIEVPAIISEFDIPFVYAPILQLIAYHAAQLKGFDIDKPRNLAKSVTVE